MNLFNLKNNKNFFLSALNNLSWTTLSYQWTRLAPIHVFLQFWAYGRSSFWDRCCIAA